MNGFQQKILTMAEANTDVLDEWQRDFIKYLAGKPGSELTTNENHKLNEIHNQLERTRRR